MTLLSRAQTARAFGDSVAELGPPRRGTLSSQVTPESARKSSAVWAAQRLRANLISQTPVDVYRTVGGRRVEAPKPAFLQDPEGNGFGLQDWLFATQLDLDGYGNCVGVITARTPAGRVAQVQMASMATVQVSGKGPDIKDWHIGGKTYRPDEVWHERQYPVSGVPLGLSQIALGAMSIARYLSAQQFAKEWFDGGAFPSGTLKNTMEDRLPAKVIEAAKRRFKAAVEGRDIFVTGREWEFDMAQQTASSAGFLEDMRWGAADAARFLDVPAAMIDATDGDKSRTYANLSQENTKLLVMHLAGAFKKREDALTRTTSEPTFVKFNTDAILRLDPEAREKLLIAQVAGRTRAPSEARELSDLAPFTETQLAEFDRLFGQPRADAPVKGTAA